jgi:hypothetical protein
MYYNFEVQNGNQQMYVEEIAFADDNTQILGIKLSYSYLDSWHSLNTNQLNSLIRFLSTGEFPELYSYYDCLNPEAPEIERVYGEISRYAIITAQEAPPLGLTINIYGAGLDSESITQYS